LKIDTSTIAIIAQVNRFLARSFNSFPQFPKL